jgi:hypothetical protein
MGALLPPADVLAVTALSVVTGALVVFGGDSGVGGIGFVGLIAVLFLTLYRIDWGVYAFLAAVLMIDQFEVPEFNSLTYMIQYFNNINVIPYLPRISVAAFSPLDLHLALLFATYLAGLGFRTAPSPRKPVGWPMALGFLAWIMFEFIAGAGRGGDMTAALWELRGLGYMLISYTLFSQIIRTREQIRAVIWVCILALTFKGLEGTIRFAGLGFTLGSHDALLTHEDPVFFITLWALHAGLALYGCSTPQRTFLLFANIPLTLGFYAANRRAAFASLGASLAVFLAIMPREKIVHILKRTAPVLPILLLYVLLFWGSTSRIASPLNQIRSGFVDDQQTLGDRNYYSNLYRKLENFNLAYTVRFYPLVGIGFGTKYYQPLELVKINYALRDYMAHNNILWLLVKIGGVGFLVFWLFVDLLGVRGAMIARATHDPYLKAVAVMIVIAIINQLVAAYFDLHLVRYRTMLYMGALMGLLTGLHALLPADTAASPPAGQPLHPQGGTV